MATGTLKERAEKLETTVRKVQAQLAHQVSGEKRGWRWFVGIDADDPQYEEAERLGKNWRNADGPAEEEIMGLCSSSTPIT